MSTTMFIPMPEWQANLFLKDRKTAFQRLLQAQADVMPEVVPTEEGYFYALRHRKDAVRMGYNAYPTGFAMMRLVVHKLMHGSMMLKREITSFNDKEAGVDVYRINHEGLVHLLEKCRSDHLEVMVDEIFGPCLADPCLVKEECGDGACGHPHKTDDSQNPADGGRPNSLERGKIVS